MIKSFRPFLAISDFCGETIIHKFLCSHCGSKSAVKLGYLGKPESMCFYSGVYMCLSCGLSVINGKELNYYHDDFKRSVKREPVQLSLF